jgi:pimeloyl-ACP methyl ester carboxylesterase
MGGPLINHHRVGSGTPLVLIHGIGASWKCWKPVLPGLASRHDVIAVDLPGFGASAELGIDQPSLPHFAGSVLDLLDSLGVDDFHVAGNSMGGGIGIELLKSGRVLSYHGISPIGRSTGAYRLVNRALLRTAYYGSRLVAPVAPVAFKLRPFRAAFASIIVGRPSRTTADFLGGMVEDCAVGHGFERTLTSVVDSADPIVIPPYDGPAQLLWGTRDLILPIRAADAFAATWPGLDVVRMPGLGHVPMQDDPKLIVDTILRVTAQADAARGAAAVPSTAR